MTPQSFKAGIRARDYALIAEGVRFNKKVGLSDAEIYRYFVLPIEPDLNKGEWADLVKTALERHP